MDLIRTWPGDATTHVVVGLLAFAVIALTWRRLPVAWIVFVALYLLPSFGFGLVGLGRYVGECFPVVIATGIVLAGARRQIVAVVLTASAVAMVALALVITTEGIIP